MAILVFGVGQLVIPPLATHIARDRLSKYGTVTSVSVSAFPAIELIFGDADTVTARMTNFHGSESQLAKNIGQTSGISNMDIRIAKVTSGLVTVNDVHMTKHGGHYSGSGVITEANLRRTIPFITNVTPVNSSGGTVTFQGTADVPLLGQVTADADVSATDGKVVVSGAGVLDSFLHLTIWSNPKVYVQSLTGTTAPGGMSLAATWRLG